MKWLRSPKTPILTSLPTGLTSADDGREIRFLADQTIGVVWLLRYRHFQSDGVTVNPSAYKWEAVGALPLIAERMANDPTTAPASPYTIPINEPAVIVPLAGDYECDVQSNVSGNNGQIDHTILVNGSQPAGIVATSTTVVISEWRMLAFNTKLPGTPAGATIRQAFRSATSMGVNHTSRRCRVTPVRVG